MATTTIMDRDFIKDVIHEDLLQNSLDYIASHFSPEDVFPKEELEVWAEHNGYKKED